MFDSSGRTWFTFQQQISHKPKKNIYNKNPQKTTNTQIDHISLFQQQQRLIKAASVSIGFSHVGRVDPDAYVVAGVRIRQICCSTLIIIMLIIQEKTIK